MKTQKYSENIYVVKSGFANFFIYKDSDNLVMFDSGMAFKSNLKKIRKLGLEPEKILHIFLTHGDFDHTDGIKLFPQAKIYISKNEEPYIIGKKGRFLFYKSPRIKREYILVEPDDEINIGSIKIKVIPAPGHTPGSVAYLVNEKYLFSGDAIIPGFINSLFQDIFHMWHKKQRETKKMLLNLDGVKEIFCAHGGVIKKK